MQNIQAASTLSPPLHLALRFGVLVEAANAGSALRPWAGGCCLAAPQSPGLPKLRVFVPSAARQPAMELFA